MNVIEAKKLKKIYGNTQGIMKVTALEDVNLTVQAGEFIGVMGPSGSGKTTLMNLLSGIDTATTGEILVEGNDITKMKKDEFALFRRRKIGYIFQDFNLLDSLTIKENVGLPLILDQVKPETIEERVQKVMDYFNISSLAEKYPYQVSGGQKQRVAAARALIPNPAIIFADEPTGNLDSKSSFSVMQMLSDMNTDRKATILMVTHDVFAASWCKSIIFIKDGKIHSELQRSGDRKDFIDKILQAMQLIGEET